MHNSILTLLTSVIIIVVLSACSSGGVNTSVTSFELLDPTQGAGNKFGSTVAILPNGNIIVSAPYDSTYAVNSGAVHLYNPYTQTLIASFYGDTANDSLGNGGITTLANNNFVIASTNDDEGGVVNAGSVRLVNGTTGVEINILAGDTANDFLGNGGITALANNNFVIVSTFDDETVVDGGTVRLVNGTTGIEINMLAGDTIKDWLGEDGITALANNNFVIASTNDDEGGVVNAGSVRLVNGTTGVEINMLAGDTTNDWLGEDGITALANNNFVIASANDDEGGVVNAGSVRLVNGTTGVPISTMAGDTASDRLGYNPINAITALANYNFVIASPSDDETVVDGGTVRLVNGTTGVEINMLAGDTAYDNLGNGGITALANSSYVIASFNDDEGGVVNAGSVRLVNGTTGVPISTMAGDTASDQVGYNGITALANYNFVIASPLDDETVVDGGTVRLVDGTTGVEINMLAGDTLNDQLGSTSITALANNNFVIASLYDDETVVDGGTVRLVNGATGIEINMLAGDTTNDWLGEDGITALANNNFVIASASDDEGGIVDAGSVRQRDGTTGNQIRIIKGSIANDMISSHVIESSLGDFYIISLPVKDNNSLVDSGFVTLIARPSVN